MKKSIKNANKTNIVKTIKVSHRIEFDFCFFKFKSVKCRTFTNFVKDKVEATKIINRLFCEFTSDITTDNLTEQNHYHTINEVDKINLIDKILLELNTNEFTEKNENEYYQIGLKQGLRIICCKISNTIYPLFLDPHHLIYQSEKYNYKDFMKYHYCIFKDE